MNITIKTIPHNKHRYATCGDWWFDKKGDLQIRVSDMGNWKYEYLVALHELIEVALCKERGIKQEDVDDFDMQFEKEREEGQHDEEAEPGDDRRAPYKKEHFFATNIEFMMIGELGVDNNDYADTIYKL